MSLISIPKVFMILFGLYPPETFEGSFRIFYRIYRLMTIAIYSIFVTCLIIELPLLIVAEQKPERISGSFALVVTLSVLFTKAIIYKKNKIPNMCLSVVDAEHELWQSEDHEVRQSYSSFLKFGIFINGALILTTTFAVGTFIAMALFELWKVGTDGWNFDERAFMYEVYFPFDRKQYFTWVILFNIYVGSASLVLSIATRTMFFSLVIFGTFQLHLLQIRLKKFHMYTKDFNGDILLTIKDFIKDHKNTIRYIENLNESTKYVILLEFLLNSLNVATVLFQMITVPSLIEVTFSLLYLSMLGVEIFILGWTSNEIKIQSLRISNAIYESPWYEQSESVKKLLFLMIIRSQKPLTLTIGPFSAMATETLILMMKASYSYVTLMKNSYDRDF